MRRFRTVAGLVGSAMVALLVAPAVAIYDSQTVLAGGMTTTDVKQLTISPDGRFAVFVADRDISGRFELYSTRLDGTASTVTKLSTTAPAAGDVSSFKFAIAPDSSRVVYYGDLRTDAVDELFSAPLDTSDGQTRLSTTPVTGGDVRGEFMVAADSSRVVYYGDLRTDDVLELFSAPLDTPDGQTLLSTTPVTGGNVVGSFVVTAESSRVVYFGDLRIDDVYELFSAPLDTPDGQTVLSTTPVTGGDVELFAVAPDSSRVVYNGDLRADNVYELFSAPLDTINGQTVLSTTPVTGGDVEDFEVAPDSSRVIYFGDPQTDNVYELFSAPMDAPSDQTRLSSTPVTGGDVGLFVVAPDSSRVAYTGDLRTDDVYELFSAPLDTPDGQTLLSTTPVTGGDAERFVVAPDSSRVIYRGDLRSDDVLELFSAPVEKPNGQTLISSTPVTDGDVDRRAVAPDSSFAVYTGDLRTDGAVEVYASGVGQLPARAVTDLAVDAVDTDTVTFSWNPPPGGSQITSYRIDVDPSPTRRVTTTVDGDTTTTITGLDPDTDYTATVVAINDAGDSPAATVTFTTEAVPDPEPTEETAGVLRLSGETRFDTAAAAALDRFDPADVEVVYLATGRNFPDALAGGPLAAHVGAPILLVEPTSLPGITATALAMLNPSRVIALGGAVAVSDDVLAAAGASAGATTDRLAGGNRYATATAIADALIDAGGDPARVFLAIGTNFPDAVAGGPATGGAPILLTSGTTLSDPTGVWLAARRPGRVVALGGEAVLTKSVLDAAAVTAAGTSSRLAGDTRYATATAIAATLRAPDTVYVAVGTNFPDALTGGPAAAAEDAPIVLITGGATDLPPDTAAYLDGLPALRRIVVLGGTTAVPSEIITQLQTLLD